MAKYIFVTGGVVSGLGKGITAASADDFASCFQRGRLGETHRTVAFGSLYFIGEIEALFEAK